MSTSNIAAIDVHAHYGDRQLLEAPFLSELASGGPDVVLERARRNNIEWTIVSPLQAIAPRGRGASDVMGGNDDATQLVDRTDGLLQWVVIDPTRPDTYRQADTMLSRSKCVGIKIHPEEHCYPIREFGAPIFEYAARHRAVVLTHSGHENSLPDDFLPFADEYPDVQLILAHIGCSDDRNPTRQVRAVQRSHHRNVYVDTSSAMSITPNLIEWAVREVGATRVLFGTDTPLYHAGMQRLRIDQADISDDEKRQILRDNAEKLLLLRNF